MIADTILGGHILFLSLFSSAPFYLDKRNLELFQYVPVLVGGSWLLFDGRCCLSDLEFNFREKGNHLNLFQSGVKMVTGKTISVRRSNQLGWALLLVTVLVTKFRLRKK